MREIIESIEARIHRIDIVHMLSMDSPRQILFVASAAWCAAILAAPLFESPAAYAFFSTICHQNPARSWLLGGEPLGVCIRCASIYAGFLVGLVARISPRTWLLRISLLTLGLEFSVARLGWDFDGPRAFSGLLLGLSAAGFVERGFQGLLHRHWANRPFATRRGGI